MTFTKIYALIIILTLCLIMALYGAGYAQLANNYPNDIGIENDPDVFFVEMFNDELNQIASRYNNVSNLNGMSLDADVPPGSWSTASLKMTNIGGQNNGGHLYKKFEVPFDSTVYLRYYVKYPEISNGYIHHESIWLGAYHPATNWPNPRAGTCGLGDQRISIAYEPTKNIIAQPRPDMDTYLYWGDMRSWNEGSSCFGNTLVNRSPSAQIVDWNEWMCIEIMVKLNHPHTAYNGELRIWQNGVEVGHWGPGFPNGKWSGDRWFNDLAEAPFGGFRWRSDPELKINYLWIEYYDDTSPEGVSHHIKYNHIVMAKSYIGPISQASDKGIVGKAKFSLKIFPNPFYSSIHIHAESALKNASLTFYNELGQMVQRFYQLEGKQIVLESLQLPEGIYWYELQQNQECLGTGKIAAGK
ncbi:MAG: T9SS type A sorting domain-containing protein [Prolixibacteraceae bacterium]|jgi:hypothetical protein|nr:T9SS type A sorting domain-containing protein [Prolixibacteraceae bacterium]